jgi:uncharacterized protein YbjT (DUF2867 family)
MKLILLGATGMVGQGVLREALAEPDVESVLCVGRRTCGVSHPKVRELLIPDLFDFAAHEPQLTGFDACIWALGVSSVGLDETAYSRVTEELTLTWAKALLRLNPNLSFCYCSGMGADGKAMWARVRRRVEAGLKELPFKHVGIVRPGLIRPMHGITHRYLSYRIFLVLMWPVFPLLVWLAPGLCTTTARLGRAMLRVVRGQGGGYILESRDINRLGRGD